MQINWTELISQGFAVVFGVFVLATVYVFFRQLPQIIQRMHEFGQLWADWVSVQRENTDAVKHNTTVTMAGSDERKDLKSKLEELSAQLDDHQADAEGIKRDNAEILRILHEMERKLLRKENQ